MIEGFEDYVGLMIVSDEIGKIEDQLINDIGAGITVYKGTKGHGKRGPKQERDIIHTVINRIDIRKTYNLIESVDENAFVIEFDVNNIKGGILRKYLTKDGIKKLTPNFKS